MADINNDAKKFDVTEVVSKLDYSSIEEAVNQIFQTTNVGEIDSAMGNSLYGINHRQSTAAIPINKDNYGLTFFTRPKFNFTTDNLNTARQLGPLLTTNEASIQRAIRCYFDRELVKSGIRCPFVDNSQAFMPLLTNNLMSINGWPDVRVDTFTAPDGAYKQTWFMVDSVAQDYSAYDITADFRNMPGSPITLLFFVWLHYMSLIYQGIMVPYFENIIEDEIDYQTRIYRLVLDVTKTKIQGISACAAAIPLSAPMGAKYNFSNSTPLNNSFDTISVPFRAVGAMYEDTMLMYEFNCTVIKFNDTMRTRTRASMYQKVDIQFLEFFNHRGYPWINMDTSELEWWVPNDVYKERMSAYLKQKNRSLK